MDWMISLVCFSWLNLLFSFLLHQDNHKIAYSFIYLLSYLFIYLFIYFFDWLITLLRLLVWLSRNSTLPWSSRNATLFCLFSSRKSWYLFSLRKRLHCFCVTIYFVKLHLLIIVLFFFHAGCWMAMYNVCAASQDWLIQDLVRGRKLICFKIISEESKLRIPFPFLYKSISFTSQTPL